MRHWMKKTGCGLLVAGMLLGMAACGESKAPAAPESPAEEPASGAASQTESEPAASGDTVELKLIATTDWEKVQAKLIESALEESFYPENPNIKLSFEYVPFAELDKKIITSHVGGVYYDITLTNHPSVGVFAESGVNEPLDEYVQSSGIDLSQYNQSFLESAYYDGKMYALPYETDCRVLAVNKALLDAEGLELPKTKEDMLEVVRKTTKDTDGDGKYDQYGMIFQFTNVWFPTYDLGQWALGNGGSFYVEKDGKYEATFDTPEMLDFMNWAKEMIPYQPTDFVSFDGTQLTSLFADGKVAMYVMGPWTYSDPIILDKGIQFETILNPAGNSKSGSTMGGWHLGMGSQSAHKDEAWKVLSFLAQPEISAKTVSSLPPRFDAYDYAPFNDAKYTIFKDQLQTASLPAPAIPELTEAADLWNKQFQAAMLDEISVEDALKTAQTDVQALLDKRG